MNNKKIAAIIFVLLICIFLPIIFGNIIGDTTTIVDKWNLILTWVVALVSLYIGVLSFIIVFKKLINGDHCSKRQVKKGGEQLAEKIAAFSPTKIVFVTGNTSKLYDRYIKKYNYFLEKDVVRLTCLEKFDCKLHMNLSDKELLVTNKLLLLFDQFLFNSEDRVVLLDDVVISGDTITKIHDHLIDKFGINPKNIVTLAYIVDKDAFANTGLPAYYIKKETIDGEYSFPWRKK